jgi:type II secretion system protein H
MVRLSSAGFSYLDVLLALLILAILLTAAVPTYRSWVYSQKLESVAQRLAWDLRCAGTHALLRAEPVSIEFDPTSHVYRIVGMTDPARPTRSYEVKLATWASGVRLVSVTFTNKKLVWNRLGLPSESGSITLRWGSWQAKVSVNPAGRVSAARATRIP